MCRTTLLVKVYFQIEETNYEEFGPISGWFTSKSTRCMGLAHALLVSRESEHGHRKFESLMTGMASVFQCQYAGIDAADCVYSSRKQRIMIFLNREYCIRSQLIDVFLRVVNQKL